MSKLNDFSLVTRVAVFHDRRAFDQLVREYQSPVRRFFLHQTLGDSQLSDDLAQDTFLKAYTSIAQFRGTASFLTWVLRIAYNVWYDHVRSRHTTADLDGATVRQMTAPASAPAEQMDVYAALARLRPEERTCITLQLVDGYPIDQIAQITGLPAGTVKSHLSRGKQKLTDYLKQNGYERR